AKNYNPFYETPFDGEVGKRENTFYREDYGVTFNNTQIKLNNTIQTKSYSGASPMTINGSSTENLVSLQSGIVLSYNLQNKEMKFNPSRPTPVVMKIVNSTTGRLSADYTLSGTSDPLLSEWTTKSSTFSNSSNSCLDFEENDKRLFVETRDGEKRSVVWVSAKGGTLVLGTTFFTPKSLASAVRVTPVDSNKVTLLGPSGTKNGSSVMISNYNLSSEVNYDDLEFLFNQVKNEQMCMSKSSNSIINIWWNQGYLDEQIDSLITNKKGNC
ncbi:MAG TPA: hypothetical protein PKK60_04375, partial [archaeon]|nr:hypothetical protein [archaeon]